MERRDRLHRIRRMDEAMTERAKLIELAELNDD
jgi:hypothetical protein